MLGALLLFAAIVLVATNYKEVREINIFAAVLVVQSLPFMRPGIAAIEGTQVQRVCLLAQPRGARQRVLLPAGEGRRGGARRGGRTGRVRE